jgi:TetR/AcrR family transcriptional regulator, tetracycline repressor protein
LARAPLSRDAIFRAGLELVDSEGIEALTMRRLARTLGVAPMSLYTHVPNKEDLLMGVVNEATTKMVLPPPDTPPWDAMRTVIREFRRVAHLHPNLVPLITRQPPTGVDSLRILESSLDALRRAGLDPATCARAYRMSSSFAIGFVSLESGGYFRPPEDGGGGGGLDLGALRDMPRLMEVAPHLATWDSDAEFESGMEAIIDAIRRTFGIED